jgi:hypothetical protein
VNAQLVHPNIAPYNTIAVPRQPSSIPGYSPQARRTSITKFLVVTALRTRAFRTCQVRLQLRGHILSNRRGIVVSATAAGTVLTLAVVVRESCQLVSAQVVYDARAQGISYNVHCCPAAIPATFHTAVSLASISTLTYIDLISHCLHCYVISQLLVSCLLINVLSNLQRRA